MANPIRYYFLSPTWHNHPKFGALQLGNIFTDLKAPEQPLYRGPSPPPPELVDSPPDPESGERTESWQSKYEFSTEQLRAGQFGIWTKFLGFLGLGVDLGYEWGTNKETVYTFEHLSTTEFLPTDTYIQDCLKSRAVARHLEQTRHQFNRKLYIVTGIKAVTGAQANSSQSSAHTITAGFEIDPTIIGGPPISFGPETKIERDNREGFKWLESSDFVFAYRVQRIDVDGKTREAKGHKDYNKGALLGEGRKGVAEVPFALVDIRDGDLKEAGFVEEDVVEGVLVVTLAPAREAEVGKGTESPE